MEKSDKAARFGLCTNAFFLLLSEYIVYACEHGSPVLADMLAAAFRCLDKVLCLSLDKFSHIAMLPTNSSWVNLLKALFIPYEDARKQLNALPLLGNDLFAEKFQEILEAWGTPSFCPSLQPCGSKSSAGAAMAVPRTYTLSHNSAR